MNECLNCGATLAEARCPVCGAPAAPAVQAELGHLRYILADLHQLIEPSEPGAPHYRDLMERYVQRRQRLLSATGTIAGAQAPAQPVAAADVLTADTTPAVAAHAAVAEGVPLSRPATAANQPRRSIDAPILLLGLGAFLVTVASLIFVGYSWTLLGGAAKTLVMTALTGAFLVTGRVCRQRPALRPAGATFTLIGAALAPLTFVAAHNFWLGGTALSGALLGVLAALACAGLYARLALTLGGRLYPLATPLALVAAGGFGLAAADVPRTWWAASAAVCALALWQSGQRWLPERLDIFRRPACWVSGAVAACAALGALAVAGDAASRTRAEWWPVAAALLVLAAQASLAATAWRNTMVAGLALIFGTGAVSAGVAALGGRENAFAMVGVGLAAAALAGSGAARAEWRRALLPYAGLLALLAPWLTREMLGHVIGAAALAVFLLACVAVPRRPSAALGGGILAVAAGYGLVALALGTPGEAGAGLLFHWLAAAGLGLLAVRTGEGRWFYVATALVAVGTAIGLSAPGLPAWAYAPVFSLVGLALTAGGLALARRGPALSERLVEGGGALAAVGVLVAVVMAEEVGSWGLVLTLGLLAGLLGLVAAVQRRLGLAGLASGVALAALFVQFDGWRLTDVHWYSVPLALWLGGLALVCARLGKTRPAQWLAWAGVLTLVGPTLLLGLVAEEGWRYALAVGAEALALLAVGLRWGLRAPVAGGTLALTLVAARQVFDSLRSLPSWVLIGLVGLTLLGVALVLLLRREQVGRARSGLQAQWQAWR